MKDKDEYLLYFEITFLIIVFITMSVILRSGIKYDNKVTYKDQDGKETNIDIPRDAFYDGYRWEENELILTFVEEKYDHYPEGMEHLAQKRE